MVCLYAATHAAIVDGDASFWLCCDPSHPKWPQQRRGDRTRPESVGLRPNAWRLLGSLDEVSSRAFDRRHRHLPVEYPERPDKDQEPPNELARVLVLSILPLRTQLREHIPRAFQRARPANG